MKKSLGIVTFIIMAAFILGTGFLGWGVNFYTDWVWFESLDFANTFLKIFKTKLGIRLGLGVLFALTIFINLSFTKKKVIKLIEGLKDQDKQNDDGVIDINPKSANGLLKGVSKRWISIIYLLFSIFIGFLFSSIGSNSWEVFLKFLNSTPFNVNDPLFAKDISFYIFKLPFYRLAYQLLSTLVIISGLIVGVVYLITSGGSSILKRLKNSNQAKYHLSILVSIFFGLKAWGYRLNIYELLYSKRGVVFGASYTDVNANLISLKVLSVIAAVIAIFILINIFIKNMKLIIGGIATLFLASFLLGNIYPTFVQQYQVEPNEIAREAEYIKHNIKFTQQAYNLDGIEEREFPVEENLSYQDVLDNQSTISNIRLWDSRPLKSTYGQLQGIRSYYTFNDIDIDRYQIGDKMTQVMLGARELNQDLLSQRAQTWVNKKLNYTHGFGMAMSPVNEVTEGGLPEFLIKDIPPQTKNKELKIKEPRIYYGELSNEYVIANTRAKEFDYPQGDKNQYTTYQGSGGVELDSLFKKLAFSLKYGTMKILLNSDIKDDSRLMFERNIKGRISKVAPFLSYDRDPYLVLGDDGHLYWIQDAYTTTNMYPYSEPQRWGNYIRNSVKVVVDAYNGSIDFYIVDESDPLINTYNKIFPELFTVMEEMPAGLKDHLRYPQDLFEIQADLYRTYHMQDPTVFYNKEDLWNIPQENYAGESIAMEPYYTLMKLPKEEENFLLMLPFTPVKKNNMISWLAAKSGDTEYGKLLLYKFPKRKLVYGPMQIESRIDQNSEISSQLSLWNQRGSRVIRGNLLTIPINNSILYVEPIYLQAEQSQLPEMKRVIVSYGDRVIMEVNLELALKRLFNITEADSRELSKKKEKTGVIDKSTLGELVFEIKSLYQSSQQELKAGNWSEYGRLLEELEDKLKLLENKVK